MPPASRGKSLLLCSFVLAFIGTRPDGRPNNGRPNRAAVAQSAFPAAPASAWVVCGGGVAVRRAVVVEVTCTVRPASVTPSRRPLLLLLLALPKCCDATSKALVPCAGGGRGGSCSCCRCTSSRFSTRSLSRGCQRSLVELSGAHPPPTRSYSTPCTTLVPREVAAPRSPAAPKPDSCDRRRSVSARAAACARAEALPGSAACFRAAATASARARCAKAAASNKRASS
jgi:hypothetical protein